MLSSPMRLSHNVIFTLPVARTCLLMSLMSESVKCSFPFGSSLLHHPSRRPRSHGAKRLRITSTKRTHVFRCLHATGPTCGPTGEGTKARAKEGSIVSARISSYLINLNLHPFGAVHGRSCAPEWQTSVGGCLAARPQTARGGDPKDPKRPAGPPFPLPPPSCWSLHTCGASWPLRGVLSPGSHGAMLALSIGGARLPASGRTLTGHLCSSQCLHVPSPGAYHL